ncbi:MAG: CBS domain-containing protein [Chloroflexota bacterium]|nr:CBS domain-containing protein [Chloroflexota bacterium]
MQVGDVMTSPAVSITPDASIGEAFSLTRDGGFRRLPVVQEGQLLGIVTDRDLRQAMDSPLVLREKRYSDYILDAVKVKSCMTPDPATVTSSTSLLVAARMMRQLKIGGMPVLDGDELVGIITTTNLLDFLIVLLEKEAQN